MLSHAFSAGRSTADDARDLASRSSPVPSSQSHAIETGALGGRRIPRRRAKPAIAQITKSVRQLPCFKAPKACLGIIGKAVKSRHVPNAVKGTARTFVTGSRWEDVRSG